MRCDIDAVEQRAGFGRVEYGCLARGDGMPRPAHRVRWVDWHDLAVDQPGEEVPQRCKPLFDRGCGQFVHRGPDPGRDMQRLDIGDRRHADFTAPGEEFLYGTPISLRQARNSSAAR
jgi:hypothetical protein